MMDKLVRLLSLVLVFVGGLVFAKETGPSHSVPTQGRNEAIESTKGDIAEDLGEKDVKSISEALDDYDKITTGPKATVGEEPSPEKI